jgi:hypothetical protein
MAHESGMANDAVMQNCRVGFSPLCIESRDNGGLKPTLQMNPYTFCNRTHVHATHVGMASKAQLALLVDAAL